MGKNKHKGYFASRMRQDEMHGGRSQVKTDYGEDLDTTNALSLLNSRIKDCKKAYKQKPYSRPWIQTSEDPEVWVQPDDANLSRDASAAISAINQFEQKMQWQQASGSKIPWQNLQSSHGLASGPYSSTQYEQKIIPWQNPSGGPSSTVTSSGSSYQPKMPWQNNPASTSSSYQQSSSSFSGLTPQQAKKLIKEQNKEKKASMKTFTPPKVKPTKIKKAQLLERILENYGTYLTTFNSDRNNWVFDQDIHDWLIKNMLTRVEGKYFETLAGYLEFLRDHNCGAENVLLLRQILAYSQSRYIQLTDLLFTEVQTSLPKIQRLLNIVSKFNDSIKNHVILKRYLDPLINTKIENFNGTEFNFDLILLGRNNLTKRLEDFEHRQRQPAIVERKQKIVEYLNQWRNNRSNWVFNKSLQCGVHENMFFPDMICDELFETALREIASIMLCEQHLEERESCRLSLARSLKCRINRQKYSTNEVDDYDQMEINRSARLFKIVEQADRQDAFKT